MKAIFLLTAILTGQAEERGPTLPEAVKAIHADLARLPAGDRPYVRYLIRPQSWDAKTWDYFRPVFGGHVNQLSRQAVIERPRGVGAFALRVTLSDYGWTPELWDKLVDPYTTLPVVETVVIPAVVEWWPGGRWSDGVYYPAKAFQYTVRKAETVTRKTIALAPWLYEDAAGKHRLADLVEWTQARAPFVRADWFFNATAAQKNRVPGFYGFFGVKTEADVFKLVGFDRKLSEAFRPELLEAIGESGVTVSKVRALARFDTLGGAIWRTDDFKDETLKRIGRAANPLKTFGRDIGKHADGFEGFAHLPNGFWFTWGANGKGDLVDVVPGDIANDGFSRSTDKQIHPNVSCLRCHTKSGLQDIDGWARNSFYPPLKLNEADYEKAILLRQQYLRKLEPFLARDRAVFEAAVLEATGLKCDDYLKRYAELWEKYEDAKVTTAYIAADVGVSEDDLRDAILRSVKRGYADEVVGPMIHKGARARSIGIRSYEDAVPAVYEILRGK